jgi:hypothetical protein
MATPWDAAVPVLLLTLQRQGRLDAVAQVRLDRDGTSWMIEMASPRMPDVRVRRIDRVQQGGDPAPELELMGRLPDGTFERLVERADGSLFFADHPDLPVPAAIQGFGDCMKRCFLDVQVTLTWLQGICLAACLLAAGLTALASGGAAAAPVVTGCLTACGLSFLITRAVHLAACLLACALE